MGRSLVAYAPGSGPPTVEPKTATLKHPTAATEWSVALIHNVPRFTERAGADHFEVEAAYLVGSGSHTRSYFWRRGAALFEAPLTWYRSRGAFGLSPGYDSPDHPGMFREVRADCLYCHADPAPLLTDGSAGARAASASNRFGEPGPGPIGCTRCHGDARAHVAARQAGAVDNTIIVPTRLDSERRADVCDQCHLQGAVRVARPGRSLADYLPGERLSDSVVTFVRETPGQDFGIASHGERLRLSACGKGALTCTQCHAPHDTRTERSDRSSSCRSCHGESHRSCSTQAGGRDTADCAACHMALAQTRDIPHVSMTDHFIRARLDAGSKTASSPTGPDDRGALRAVGAPKATPTTPDDRLMLGRAYADAARLGGDPLARDEDRRQAISLLTEGLRSSPEDAFALTDLAAMHQQRGDNAASAPLLERAFALRPNDATLARATAASRLSKGELMPAVKAAERAATAAPEDPASFIILGSALAAVGRREDASQAILHARALGPTRADVTVALAVWQKLGGDFVASRAELERAIRQAPLSVPAHLEAFDAQAAASDWAQAQRTVELGTRAALSRGPMPESLRNRLDGMRSLALAKQGRAQDAAKVAMTVVQRGGQDAYAAHALAELALRSQRPQDAVTLLDRAITWSPDDAALWATMATALARTGQADVAARAAARARRLGSRP